MLIVVHDNRAPQLLQDTAKAHNKKPIEELHGFRTARSEGRLLLCVHEDGVLHNNCGYEDGLIRVSFACLALNSRTGAGNVK